METMLPTIRVSEVAERATAFARQLAAKLEAINEAHSAAHLSVSAQEVLEKTSGGQPLGPSPFELVPTFERLFFTHIASRYVIVQDQP